MNVLDHGFRKLAFCALGTALAGCGGSHATMPLPAEPAAGFNARSQTSSGFQSLYAFTGRPNGAFPWGGLVAVHGTLYGMTTTGGATGGSECGRFGCGVVFKVGKTGSEHVVYRFKGLPDGASPEGSLVELGGALYGTTTYGGSGCASQGGCGTVFRISTSGAEQVVYRFQGAPNDGENPQYNETLLVYKGALYGTTDGGGSAHGGTVYEVTPSGKERVLHSLGKNLNDGANPSGSLIAYDGTLYGTASSGGTAGQGVVFSITTSGKVRILYRFQGGTDGSEPNSLIAVNGAFYGTTTFGGGGGCYDGCGTVFALTPSGTESVIYRFQGGANDGANPPSGGTLVTVTHHKDLLYGTTDAGGCPGGSPSGSCGTVFVVGTSGAENVLHEFEGGVANGFEPLASLVSSGELLYGTTYFGGTTCYGSGGSGNGCGTVFRISP